MRIAAKVRVPATVLVMLTLLAGIVRAGDDQAKIEATRFTIDSGVNGGGRAECPGSKRAVGGGVVQTGPAYGLYVNTSGPLDASGSPLQTKDGDVAKQWYAAVSNNSGEDDREFSVFAICSADSDAKIETERFVVDTSQYKEKRVKCPGTKRALGGGVVHVGSSEGLSLSASGPLDASGSPSHTKDGDIAKQWYVAVLNVSGENNRVFKAYAICSAHSNAKIEAEKFNATENGYSGGRAECKGSKRALGGGIVHGGSLDSLSVSASGPLDASGSPIHTTDGDVAKQWYTAVSNPTNHEVMVKALATCV